MKIRVVIPDARPEAVEELAIQYDGLARPDTEISAAVLDADVPREADPTDPYVLPAILIKIQEAEREGMDAVIIHCMEDPGLEAGRQLVRIPVVGPAQASFHMAAMLGYKFSVLFPMENRYYIEKLVDRYGLASRLASVELMDANLEVLETDKEASLDSIVRYSSKAVNESDAHSIVLACLFMMGQAEEAQIRLAAQGCPVPVIDPGLLAVRTAETMVDLNVTQSMQTYPRPLGISEPYWRGQRVIDPG